MRKRLQFRPLGSSGAFPAWFRALKGRSGVYHIKGRESGALVYIGESHTGRLKKTLARHFQAWQGKTAGPTYRRGQVVVAVEITPDKTAVARQNKRICAMNPRDNEKFPDCRPDHHASDNPF